MHQTAQAKSSKTFFLFPGKGPSDTHFIQEALDTCHTSGGGTVILEAGQYRSGTLRLPSHVHLHLKKGAVLSGSSNMDEYLRREGPPGARLLGSEGNTALIFAENADHIGLSGEGVLDGCGKLFFRKKTQAEIPDWVEEKRKFGTWVPGFESALTQRSRPKALILFSQCRHIKLEDLHVQDSPAWTIHLLGCSQASIRGITLRGALDGSNTDGIDLDSCNDVLVENCDIFTGDDAISLKSTNLWGIKAPSRRITVRNCRLRSTTHGFTIGTETQEDFEDIVLENSSIEQPGKFHTLTGIGLSSLDGGSIRRVRISKVTIDAAIAPLQIRLGNVGRGQTVPTSGTIEDVSLKNVTIRGAQGNNLIVGLPGHSLKNVRLENLSFELACPVDPSLMMSRVPELPTEFPCHRVWRCLPAYGLFCRNVETLLLSNIIFTKKVEDARPALWTEQITSLIKTNVTEQ